MKKVTLFYRDGSNYKCTWDVEIEDAVMASLPPPDCNGQNDIHDLGLEIGDIPLVQEYGESGDDHPFVTVEAVEDIH